MRRERLLALLIAGVLVSGIVAATSVGHPSTRRVAHPTATRAPATAPPVFVARPAPTRSASRVQRPHRSHRPSAPARTPRPTRPPSKTVTGSGAPGADDPLTISVTLSQISGTTQTPFLLRVVARDGDGQARIDSVDWGDGSSYSEPMVAVSCPMPSPTPPPDRPSPSRLDEHFGHAWRQAASFRLVVYVSSRRAACNQGSHATPESLQAHFEVPITGQDPDTSNGPAGPSAGALELHPSDQGPRNAEFFLPANDTDGWLVRFTVDWGDGTAKNPQPAEEYRTCDDGSGHRYPGLQAQEATGVSARHAYAKPGSYRVTVSVFSAGCAGKDVQNVSKTGTVRV